MRNKDYRELQISSSLLVFIFIGIIIVGIVIFLLGVSVGKKQTQIINESEISDQKDLTQVDKKETVPSQKSDEQQIEEQVPLQESSVEAQKKEVPTGSFYYIQIGAFNVRDAAESLADQLKKEGFPSIVLDPFPSDKKPVYRVRVGGYTSKEEADEVKNRLKTSTKRKSDYFIIRS